MFSLSDYEAVTTGMARVRLAERGVLKVSGADRTTWLQGLLTNDVSTLQPGRRLYSAYLTPQGRMMADLWLVAAPDALLLDVPAPLVGSLAPTLDSLVFAEDIRIDDVTAEAACTAFIGVPPTATDPGGAPGAGVLVADDLYGRPALFAYGDADALVEQAGLGRLKALPHAGLDALDVARIEAGVPKFLVDMTGDTIPLEAGIEDRAISFTKGCYVGQEIIVRVTTRGGGRVAKRLVGLSLDGGGEGTVPQAGAAIHTGDREVGRITSATWSPRLESVIALGYVHRDFITPGTRLEVRHGEQLTPAIVTALPFVTSTR